MNNNETIHIHPHAVERMVQRDVSEAEVIATIVGGERFPVKFDRTGFRRNFACSGTRRGKEYGTKQIEVIAVREARSWLVLTVIAKWF